MTSTDASLLQAHDLRKRFGTLTAVDGIDLSIEHGTCLGLLGPNGAGKTTTVEMLEGILPADSGEIRFDGTPIGPAFRQQAGIMFQNTALQDYIKVQEALELFQAFYRHTRPLEELIRRCALDEFLHQDVRHLSGGQRQRLLLAIALVNDPEILFLDEPTTGLDPQSRRNFWQLIHDIKAEGKTVLLTTHYMDEAQELCDRIAIMDHGRIIAQGTPQALLQKQFDTAIVSLPERLIPAALEQKLEFDLRRINGMLEILSDNPDETIRQLLELGISLRQLQVRPHTLEDLFLELTGHQLRG